MSLQRSGIAWHPNDGAVLAVPGRNRDVVLYERLSWSPTAYLSGAHTKNVNLVVFSPNGKPATFVLVGSDCKIIMPPLPF